MADAIKGIGFGEKSDAVKFNRLKAFYSQLKAGKNITQSLPGLLNGSEKIPHTQSGYAATQQ